MLRTWYDLSSWSELLRYNETVVIIKSETEIDSYSNGNFIKKRRNEKQQIQDRGFLALVLDADWNWASPSKRLPYHGKIWVLKGVTNDWCEAASIFYLKD